MNTLKTMIFSGFLALGLAVSGTVSADDRHGFSQAELDQMLAPVALYPDTVLSHVLIAATYPLEVVQAARWSRNNPGLKGEQAVAAVERKDWDPSVKALVAFPKLLRRMDDDLEWTQRLGDAFLMQEDQVVDTIQYLRSDAYAGGHLRSNEHVQVIREKKYIYIEPASPRVVYVPYYDPRVVYVNWRWSSYPPVYWRHPPKYRTSVSFYWGSGYRIAPKFYFSSFHWSRRQVVSVHHHHHHHYHPPRRHFRSAREVARFEHARHWKHNPRHRRGVSYRKGISESRFVQHRTESSGTHSSKRPATTRSPRPRQDQRQWASQRRDNPVLKGRSATSDSRLERSRRDSTGQPANRARQSSATTPRAAVENRSRQQQRSAQSSRSEGATIRNRAESRDSAPSRATRSRSSASQRSDVTTRQSPARSRSGRESVPSRSAGSAPDQRQGASAPSRTQRASKADSRAQQRSRPQGRSESRSSRPTSSRQSSSSSANQASRTRATSSQPARSSQRNSSGPRSGSTSRAGSSRSSTPSQPRTRASTNARSNSERPSRRSDRRRQ